MSVNFLKFYCNTSLKMNTFWLLKDHVIIITDKKILYHKTSIKILFTINLLLQTSN